MKSTRKIKQTSMILTSIADAFGVVFAFMLGFLIRGSFSIYQLSGLFGNVMIGIPLIIAIFYISFSLFGVYKTMWQYAGFMDLLKLILITIGNYGIFTVIHYFIICKKNYPRSAYLIDSLFVLSP